MSALLYQMYMASFNNQRPKPAPQKGQVSITPPPVLLDPKYKGDTRSIIMANRAFLTNKPGESLLDTLFALIALFDALNIYMKVLVCICALAVLIMGMIGFYMVTLLFQDWDYFITFVAMGFSLAVFGLGTLYVATQM